MTRLGARLRETSKAFRGGLSASALLVVAVCASSGSAANGASERWRPLPGPPGHALRLSALAVDPHNEQIVYAGGYESGVFKSIDGGRSWRQLDVGLSSNELEIAALAIDPTNPRTVYASAIDPGADVGRILKTTNGGLDWRVSNAGVGDREIEALALNPRDPQTLYAGNLDGVYKSTDGGRRWRVVSGRDVGGEALAIDPQDPQTVYAGADVFAVSKTTNGGGSWQHTNVGLPDEDDENVVALAIDPQSPATVYAGTVGDGLFKSTNGGDTWLPASTGLPAKGRFVSLITVDPASPETLYANVVSHGLYKTTDGGRSWRRGGLQRPVDLEALVFSVFHPSTIYAGDFAAGIYKSTNAGTSWISLRAWPTESSPEVVDLDPRHPQTLYVADTDGNFKSIDGGRSWRRILPGRYVAAFAFDPSTKATTYVATSEGVLESTDGGNVWRGRGLTSTNISALGIDPQDRKVLYATTGSVDHSRSGGIYKTTDGGSRWSRIMDGVYEGSSNALVISPENPQTIYAAADLSARGVFKSRDGGRSWKLTLDGKGSDCLAIDPEHPRTLYAADDVYGVYKSTDAGNSWRSVNVGLKSKAIRALAMDPDDSQSLYVGTSDRGVFVSRDGGRAWSPLNTGLMTLRVLTIAPGRRAVDAGTDRSGLFELSH